MLQHFGTPTSKWLKGPRLPWAGPVTSTFDCAQCGEDLCAPRFPCRANVPRQSSDAVSTRFRVGRSLVALTPGPARTVGRGFHSRFWNRFLPQERECHLCVLYNCRPCVKSLAQSYCNQAFVRRLRQTPRQGGLISANNNSYPIAPIFLPAAAKRCPGSPTALNPAIHRINPQRHPHSDFHRISPRGVKTQGTKSSFQLLANPIV